MSRLPLPARGMTRDEAAAYVGCNSLSAFNDWVRRGIIPGPIPGTSRWDRKAIDAALDRASGLQSTMEEPSDYAKWKARAGAAQGHQHRPAQAR